jgi:integrase/recombinase XerD
LLDRRGRRKYLNGCERRAFFEAAKAESDLKEKAFCLVLYHTGCRVSEALQLSRDRVDFNGQTLVFETLKQRSRGKFRPVPIPEDLLALLQRVLSVKARSRRIWTFSRITAFRVIKEKMAASRISGSMACPKGLRHGFAVACIEAKVPLTIVQKWLGHSRLETTAIYLNVCGEEERSLAKRVWTVD